MADEIAEGVEALQEATRLLAGVALRSVDVLEGAVSLPQLRVLAVLAHLGQVRSVRVATALSLEPSTVSRLVDRLVAAGHVTRIMDPSNRSAVILELTSSGRHLVAEVSAWRQAELRRLLMCLKPAERTALTTALRQLVGGPAKATGVQAGKVQAGKVQAESRCGATTDSVPAATTAGTECGAESGSLAASRS